MASGQGEGPTPDTVVSRDAEGNPLSLYKDWTWDWTPYTLHGRPSMLNFPFWRTEKPGVRDLNLIEEQHWLMFLLIFRRPGPRLGFQSLYHYLKLLRAVARHCADRGLSVQALLESEDNLVGFFDPTGINSKHAGEMASLLSVLGALGPEIVGYQVPGQRLLARLRETAKEYSTNLKQHPPLPTRIYSHVLSTLSKEISDFENVADQYLALAEAYATDEYVGRCSRRQWAIARSTKEARSELAPSFEALLAQFEGVEGYLTQRGFECTVFGLSSALYEVQLAARLTVQAFTGMRSHEVGLLPLDCLTEEAANGRTHFMLRGTTSKLNRGHPKRTRWITSREGARAVRLAQRIARFILRAGLPDHSPAARDVPLFVSTGYVRLGRAALEAKPSGRLCASAFDMSKAEMLRGRLQIPIIQEDLVELEHIDPHRAWRSEKAFSIGGPWILTSHQLRRSLALYAQRSGLVSLPSLKRQLQHVTEEMARYYSRGSAFAKDIIGDSKRHFGYEWQHTAPVSAALSYIENVLLSDEVLFGGHANWIKRFNGQDGRIAFDREKTIAAFRRGELAYRETPMGGCVNTGTCERVAVRWLDVDCLSGCKNLVGRLDRLERVIAAQGKMVSRLDSSSVEYRTERADLDVLIQTRNVIVARHNNGHKEGEK